MKTPAILPGTMATLSLVSLFVACGGEGGSSTGSTTTATTATGATTGSGGAGGAGTIAGAGGSSASQGGATATSGGAGGTGGGGAGGSGGGGGPVVLPPSCQGAPSMSCGPGDAESCCVAKPVPGGMFDRDNDPQHPATVSPFVLDRFEVTVGRFRKFVKAYPSSKPAAGAGAHPAIPGSGWDPAWDAMLPVDHFALEEALKCHPDYATWTDVASGADRRPINCVTWYEAFAFCAWDGGRLPTEAEWGFAAAGGDEQRQYPWGDASPSPDHAVYACTGDGDPSCDVADIRHVGDRSPNGDGRWGHADLAGNLWEWALDGYADPYLDPCTDCANLSPSMSRVQRGGSWSYLVIGVANTYRYAGPPEKHDYQVGLRCARPL